MSSFKIHTQETAPEKSKALLYQTHSSLGFKLLSILLISSLKILAISMDMPAFFALNLKKIFLHFK